ncbi:MAG TPA: PilZ domain-containing protein [Anaeromyxobacter sp.]
MASRVLVVGQDADVSVVLHLHLERAGFALFCLPTPQDVEPIARAVAPHVIVLLLPAAPDASWGNALTTAQNAAKVGVRVVMVAPSREVVEPLAAVAGAERAFARSEVLAKPLLVVERAVGSGLIGGGAPPASSRPVPASPFPSPSPAFAKDPAPAGGLRARGVDLMALIDEELVDEPRSRPMPTRVEVNVSLVSEHNFYVGPTRRMDSGGVFIATAMPPPAGTRLQVRLGLADGRKIDAEGEVAFVREKSATIGRQPTGCGVKLMSLPGWAVDAIERFIQARQPIVYTPL